MSKFENYRKEYRLFLATIAAIATSVLTDETKSIFKDSGYQFFAIIVIVLILVYFINSMLDKLIDKNAGVRKFLMGDDFVEGYFYDISSNGDDTLRHAVLFKIEYLDDDFKVNGVTYGHKGNRIATWKSNSCTFSNRVMYIHYESYTKYSSSGVESGLLQLQFESPANSYSGFYYDMTNNQKFIINGYRVNPEDYKKYNAFKSPNDKRDFLIKIITESS